jgi:hypothetical protein
MANQPSQVDERTQKSGDQNKIKGNREGGAQGGKQSSNREGTADEPEGRDRGTSNLKEDDDATKDAESFGKKGNR